MPRGALVCLFVGLTSGCERTLVTSADDFGPFVVLSGRLDAALLDATRDDPADYRGGVAWLVVGEGETGVVWQPTPLEPRLFGYAMEVVGPPGLARLDDLGTAPPELDLADTKIALGLPVLYVDQPPAVRTDDLLDWLLGTRDDLALVFSADASTARAATGGHALAVVQSDLDLTSLVEHPDFVDGDPWCRWAALAPGLALYRSTGATCDAWRSVPYAQEYQGVGMQSVAPDPGPATQ